MKKLCIPDSSSKTLVYSLIARALRRGDRGEIIDRDELSLLRQLIVSFAKMKSGNGYLSSCHP
jgi:hypothetical protein